ncbi:MAG: MFS transporter [Acidobacteria bacterium]|nr:MFS transporter [Acidobacteriota bacterium]
MTERLNRSLLYTYGIADLFFMLLVNMELVFFPKFLTDYAQFSLAIVGQIVLITSLVDTVCSLVAGVILQRVNLRFGGKYRSWFLVGPPLVAVLFVLQFVKIGSDPMAATIIIIAFIASHLIWNIAFTASGAMVGRLSRLPDEQTILSANRAQGITVGSLIFSATAVPMIMFFGARTGEMAGLTVAVGVYAFLMIVGYYYVYKITAGRDPYDELTADAPKNESRQSVAKMIGLICKNPPLLRLTLAESFRNGSLFIIASFATYYFAYVLHNDAFLSVFLFCTSVGGLLGASAASWIGTRIGKRKCYWIFLALSALSCAAARIFGGSSWGFTIVLSISFLFANVPGALSTALFSDTVVYGEWKTGANIRAFAMSLIAFSAKIGVLIRSAVIALGLVAIQFVANADPTPRVINGINNLMTIVPAAVGAIAVIAFYFGYRIDDAQVLQMQNEIAAKKSKGDASVQD